MPDRSALLTLAVDRADDTPLFRQLYNELRRVILSGAAAPGSRLPATRAMAAQLRVSRTSVVSVYEQLLAEGYAEGRAGAGTFVARDVQQPVPPRRPKTAPPAAKPGPAALAAGVERLGAVLRGANSALEPIHAASRSPLPAR